MAQGLVAQRPYSQRVLLPDAASALSRLGLSLPDAFLVLNLVAFTAVLILTGRIALNFARARGATPARARAAGLLAVAALIVAPLGLRWIWYYPVLVDCAAAALGLGWAVAVTSRSNRARYSSVALALLAVLCREAWAPLIGVTVCVLLLVLPASKRRVALPLVVATLVGVGFGLWFGGRALGTPNAITDDTFGYAHAQILHFAGTGLGWAELIWDLAFGLGLIPLVLLIGFRPNRRHVADVPRPSARAVACICIAVGGVLLAPVEGLDVSRYVFYTAAPPAFAAAAAYASVSWRALLALPPLAAATLAFWNPATSLRGTLTDYFSFFSPVYLGADRPAARLLSNLVAAGLAAAVVGATVVIAWHRSTSRFKSAGRWPAESQPGHHAVAP